MQRLVYKNSQSFLAEPFTKTYTDSFGLLAMSAWNPVLILLVPKAHIIRITMKWHKSQVVKQVTKYLVELLL